MKLWDKDKRIQQQQQRQQKHSVNMNGLYKKYEYMQIYDYSWILRVE